MTRGLRRGLIALAILFVLVGTAYAFIMWEGSSSRGDAPRLESTVAQWLLNQTVPTSERNRPNPLRVHLDSADVTAGRDVYLQKCEICHAYNGSGKSEIVAGQYPRAPDLRDPVVQGMSDGELLFHIVNGIRHTGMPAWKTIVSEQDTWKMVDFIHALPKLAPNLAAQQKEAAAAKSQAEVVAYGRKLYRQEGCVECHQLDGEGGTVGPDLTVEGTRGRSGDWLVGHFKDPSAYTPGSIMFSFKQLTDEQLRALTAFLQNQKGPEPKQGT